MSVNKVNKTTGELVALANGTRMWIGTQSAHDAAVQAGTMPNNCMVCITDDGAGSIGKLTPISGQSDVQGASGWVEITTVTQPPKSVIHLAFGTWNTGYQATSLSIEQKGVSAPYPVFRVLNNIANAQTPDQALGPQNAVAMNYYNDTDSEITWSLRRYVSSTPSATAYFWWSGDTIGVEE